MYYPDGMDMSPAEMIEYSKKKREIRHANTRLPQHMLDSIKAAANSRDVPYQSLIKVWLQEKLHSH